MSRKETKKEKEHPMRAFWCQPNAGFLHQGSIRADVKRERRRVAKGQAGYASRKEIKKEKDNSKEAGKKKNRSILGRTNKRGGSRKSRDTPQEQKVEKPQEQNWVKRFDTPNWDKGWRLDSFSAEEESNEPEWEENEWTGFQEWTETTKEEWKGRGWRDSTEVGATEWKMQKWATRIDRLRRGKGEHGKEEKECVS